MLALMIRFYLSLIVINGNVQVKVGIQGAEEFGEVEEWFNYRMSRAAPETCAEFLGSFVADETNSQFTQGVKWLVWKFEVLPHLENFQSLSSALGLPF